MFIDKVILASTVVACCLALSWLADMFMNNKHAD